MNPNHKHIRKQNIDYYDKIAVDYDGILNDSAKTELVRNKMENKLRTHVPDGIVLDFGGGTGEDLQWLLKNNYSIIFCEPSEGMRSLAILKSKKLPDANILFLEKEQTDFESWDKILPFNEKANAVVANFAVLNCILNLEAFFKNLTLVTAPNADVFLMVLNVGLKNNLLKKPLQAFKSLMGNQPIDLQIEFDGKQQQVYLHSVKSIRKAGGGYFDFKSCEKLKAEGFSLIHLRKK